MQSTPMRRRSRWSRVVVAMATAGLTAAVLPAIAAPTSIMDEPLATRPNVKAKPNMLFVLDDSGSMNWSYMPDELGVSSGTADQPYTGVYGYWTPQCNGTAFDPSLPYTPPVNADGTSFPNSSFTAAWPDGFNRTDSSRVDLSSYNATTTTRTSSSTVTMGTGNKVFSITGSGNNATTFTVNADITITSGSSRTMVGRVTAWTGSGSNWTLTVNITSSTSTSQRSSFEITQSIQTDPRYFYYTYTAATRQPAMGWTYGSNGNVITSTTFYQECMSNIGSTPGSGVFTRAEPVLQSDDIKQKYANWYSYYRKRTLLMRTAVGRAFAGLDDSYRVGFTTINTTTATTGTGFHPVDDFNATQKTSIYSKLYAATANGSTPLRAALSKAGRYYANQLSGQTDPVQYSCQRNYTLLSTDGYWNTGSESSTYRPFALDGTNFVGNTDGTEARPMFDGTVAGKTTRTFYTVGTLGSCVQNNASRYSVIAQPQELINGTWTDVGNATTNCRQGSTTVVNNQTAAQLAGRTATSTPVTSNPTGGSTNSLADVAQYYYKTDLRTSDLNNCTSSASGTEQNVCSNNVPPGERDDATHQHMTTFTIGLGVSGTLTYDRNYLTQSAGSYVDLINGQANWPIPGSDYGAVNIDDLWHAAVNGRGQYYSALNAAALSEAISGVVNTIQAVNGSSAAASTSALELVAGDNNQVYKASYTTKNWVGDLQAYSLNGDTAEIGTTPAWSAQSLLNAKAYSSRNIYYRQPGATATRRTFTWANLDADSLGSNFSNLCSKAQVSSQCTELSSAELTVANSGERLVNYLRGDRTLEAANATAGTSRGVYRQRTAVLGDIINGAPVYVSKPPFTYVDAGYSTFVSNNLNRKPMIYVAANDGMLHAFSADNRTGSTDAGSELWAYVPNLVMSNMYRLADTGYESRHRYFVDGAPVIGDIKVGTAWKTILVGGLNKGGRGYYAVDITDPTNPLPLWEFTDPNLGLSYGNPVITKKADGTWVVVFASGYNNVGASSSDGDGQGRLFVLNANSGAKITDISTGVGTTDDPSGMAKINAWIDDASDNTSKRFYAGDLKGNLWRFDIDGLVEPHAAALRMAKFQINTATPQPITIRPETIEISGKPVVVVATGRYLGTGDIADTTQQSIYAVKDPMANTELGDVRASDTMVRQTFTVTGNTATITNNQVSWTSKNGWWVDLPHSGERVNVDMAVQFGTLSVGSAIPSGDACSSGGSSWRYYLNAASGTALEDPAGALWNANALIVGQSWVKLQNGQTRILRQNSDGSIQVERPPGGGGSTGVPHRVSWRELSN